MRILAAGALILWALGTASCSQPKPLADQTPVEELEVLDQEVTEEGGAGGASEESATPAQLTGLPGIDKAQDLEVLILDARGTGRLGGVPIPTGKTTPVTLGQWMLTDSGSEYEITLRSSLMPGIVRLEGQSAFLVENPEGVTVPRFRLYGGHASFYLPSLPLTELTVLTPAGPLVTSGAVFTVTVSPDFQVLVTCREGAVYLTGSQNAVAIPGQVLVADRLGRGRVYAMTPNEALVFAQRWLRVMTEEAADVVAATLPRRLAEWKAGPRTSEQSRFLALWFRQAQTVLKTSVPGSDSWLALLEREVKSTPWSSLPPAPGLLGELP